LFLVTRWDICHSYMTVNCHRSWWVFWYPQAIHRKHVSL
jgi:hypothetical protein